MVVPASLEDTLKIEGRHDDENAPKEDEKGHDKGGLGSSELATNCNPSNVQCRKGAQRKPCKDPDTKHEGARLHKETSVWVVLQRPWVPLLPFARGAKDFPIHRRDQPRQTEAKVPEVYKKGPHS
jgi:hypothetical protein